jgi:hypothetical protein
VVALHVQPATAQVPCQSSIRIHTIMSLVTLSQSLQAGHALHNTSRHPNKVCVLSTAAHSSASVATYRHEGAVQGPAVLFYADAALPQACAGCGQAEVCEVRCWGSPQAAAEGLSDQEPGPAEAAAYSGSSSQWRQAGKGASSRASERGKLQHSTAE